jgi:hypothetical protein
MLGVSAKLLFWAGSVETQTPPHMFPGRGGISIGPQMDRIQLGMEKVSAEQLFKILSGRIAYHIAETMREALGEVGLVPDIPVSSYTSPEAVVRRIVTIALRLFPKFGESHPTLGEGEARAQFARLLGGAIEKAVAEVLKALKVPATLKGEVASNIDKIKALLAKALDEFVTGGLEAPSVKAPVESALSAKQIAPPKEHGESEWFARSDGSRPGGASSTTQVPIPPPESTVLYSRRMGPGRAPQSGSRSEWASPGERHTSLGGFLATFIGFAAILSYPWKVAQMATYRWLGVPWAGGLATCLQAALSDALFVLALYGLGCALFKHRGWILRPVSAGYAFLAFAGAGIAVTIEWHTMAWNRWAYQTIIPLIPGLEVGLFPVVQMVVLPILTAHLTRWWLTRPLPAR